MKKSLYTNDHKIMLELLVQARLSAGFKQQELAMRLGVPQSFISKYETGERRLDVLELRAICLALGISLRDFIHSLESRSREARS